MKIISIKYCLMFFSIYMIKWSLYVILYNFKNDDHLPRRAHASNISYITSPLSEQKKRATCLFLSGDEFVNV